MPNDVFALVVLSDGDAPPFPALVVHDRARELPESVADLLADWDAALPRLRALAAEPDGWRPLHGLAVHAPVAPRQVLQAGANYRTHVIARAVKHSSGKPEEQVRAEAGAMMDRRIAEGEPYFFLGLPTVVAGPHDDLVLPAYSEQHDWELELAAVIGKPAFRVDREHALEHVAGYTI